MKTATATLSQLKLNPEINPRHGVGNEGLEGLMAQIRDKGCIGQIWVRPAKAKNSFEIIDGSRRYRALQTLAKAGKWKKDGKIPIDIFVADDAAARDLALAANFEREPLSPADEAVGFTRLTMSGMAIADIAAHYAVTEKLVRRRVAIGLLPEQILESLRDDEIDIGTAQLFTAHSAERALKVFKDLQKKKSLSSYQVRHALDDGSIPGTDRRCVFVGAAAYEAAGGVITRDLFSDHESWQHLQLLEDLFGKKIEDTAQALKDEGWSFVEIMRKNTHQLHSWGRSVSKETRELTKDEKIELKKLKAELKAFDGEYEKLEEKSAEDELSDAEQERIDELPDLMEARQARIDELEAPVFSARQMAKAGCVITVDEHGGPVEIFRGLIKPGSKAKANREAAEDDEEYGDDPASPGATQDKMETFTQDLTKFLETKAQHATKLAMVMHRPALAARMGLAARILDAVHRGHDCPFRINQHDSDAGETYDGLRDAAFKPFARNLGDDDDEGEDEDDLSFADLVARIEAMQPSEITAIEAFLAADVFTISSLKNEAVRAVVEMIDPSWPAEGWMPDADFFGKLNRAQLVAVIVECEPTFKTPASWKNAELMDEAAGRAQATGWLPPPLRTPSYKGPGSNAWVDARAQASADEIAQRQAAE